MEHREVEKALGKPQWDITKDPPSSLQWKRGRIPGSLSRPSLENAKLTDNQKAPPEKLPDKSRKIVQLCLFSLSLLKQVHGK